jgi:predicted kinase
MRKKWMVAHSHHSSQKFPKLVIVTGLPCSGKTSLAKIIASNLSLPLITKDGIKEILFDSLGWKDRDWSLRLSQATYALMFHLLEEFLIKKVSLIVESNFQPGRDDLRLKEIQAKAPFSPVQINCFADGHVLVDRFQQRTGHRHPGHVDSQSVDELSILLIGRLPPLQIGGTLIEVETTDFSQLNQEEVNNRIRIAIDEE